MGFWRKVPEAISTGYNAGTIKQNIVVNSGAMPSIVNGKKKKRTSTILNIGTGEGNGNINNKQAWKMGV
jgi:hypothetical protein